MKIRQGFVSNSSSSSFVMYGVELEQELVTEELESALNEILGISVKSGDGETFVGILLMHEVEDESVKRVDIPTNKQEQARNAIIKVCAEKDVLVKEEDFGIYAGSTGY